MQTIYKTRCVDKINHSELFGLGRADLCFQALINAIKLVDASEVGVELKGALSSQSFVLLA